MSDSRTTFKEWLADTLERQSISRRELARRLAEKHPGGGEDAVETHRRSIRRILAGDTNPSQKTRDAIQDALEDDTAPTVDAERAVEDDAMEALARDPEILKALMPALRMLARSKA